MKNSTYCVASPNPTTSKEVFVVSRWAALFHSLWDWGTGHYHREVPYVVRGVDLLEWLRYSQTDYDDVDRLYIDHETIGG